MIKQSFLMLLLTFIAVLLRTQLHFMMSLIVTFQGYISGLLGLVFSSGFIGRLVQDVIVLLIMPVLVSLLIALVYWAIKRVKFQHTMSIACIIWVMLITAYIR